MGKLSKELRMGIHNKFDIEVVDVKTGKVKQKAQAFNVVCNSFYTRILNDDKCSVIVFGDGTGTPSANDTALFSYVGYASSSDAYNPHDIMDTSDDINGVWRREIKRAIPNTEYVGATITEIGLSYSTSSGTIVTHAMLQDMNGNPITIEHTNHDIINIYCNLYLHYAGQDSDIHLYEYDLGIVRRALLMPYTGSNSYYGSWGVSDLAWDLRGAPINDAAVSVRITNNNNALVFTFAQIPTTKGNIGGEGLVCLVGGGPSGYTPTYYRRPIVIIESGKTTIPPTTISNESVGVGDGTTTRFKTKFSYPRNATVRVNGAVVSTGVRVEKRPVQAWDKANYLNDSNWFYFFARMYWTKPSLIFSPWKQTTDDAYKISIYDTIKVECPEIGIYRLNAPNGVIEGSNDGITWYAVDTSAAPIPVADAHYRYYRNDSNNQVYIYPNDYDGYNIIFDNPPAQGDVITIDYTTDYIPKDADHVLDVELTFTFGEWTGE